MTLLLPRRRLLQAAAASLFLPSAQALARKPLKGGVPGYHADAVHFDGATWLSDNSLSAVGENGSALFSVWLKDANATDSIWNVDPDGNDLSSFQNQFITFWTGDPFLYITASSPFAFTSAWSHLIVGVDVRLGTPAYAPYLDGVLVGQPPDTSGGFDGSSVIPFNGLPFFIGKKGASAGPPVPMQGDMADFRLFVGISGLNGSGVIPPATLALFRDPVTGKPVDPPVATATLGTVGTIMLSGTASTFGTNQGTGGVFTTTGALTDAGTSPSD